MKRNQRRNFILGALASVAFLASPVGSMKPELVDQLDEDLKARYGHALTPKSKAAVRGWPDQHFYLLRRLAVTGDKEVIKAQIGAGRAEVIAQEDLKIAREAIRSLTANMARLQQERDAARADIASAQAERDRATTEVAGAHEFSRTKEGERDAAQADARRIEALRAALERDLNDLRAHAAAEEARFMGLLTGRERERDEALRQIRAAQTEVERIQALLDAALRTAADRMREADTARRDLAEAQRNLAEVQRAVGDRERERDAAQADARRIEGLRAVLQRDIDALRARTAAEEAHLRGVLAETERNRDEAARSLREAQCAARDRKAEYDRATAESLRVQGEKKAAELAHRSAEAARAQVSRQLREMQTNIIQGLNLTSADRKLVKELNRQLAESRAEKEALEGRFRILEGQLTTFKARARAAKEEAQRAVRAEGGEEKEESKIARLERALQLAYASRDTMEEGASALRAEVAALKGERETLSAEQRRLEREIQGAEAINQAKLVRVERFLEELQRGLGGVGSFRLESPNKSPGSRVTWPRSPLRHEAASPRSPRRWHGGGGDIGETGEKPRSP